MGIENLIGCHVWATVSKKFETVIRQTPALASANLRLNEKDGTIRIHFQVSYTQNGLKISIFTLPSLWKPRYTLGIRLSIPTLKNTGQIICLADPSDQNDVSGIIVVKSIIQRINVVFPGIRFELDAPLGQIILADINDLETVLGLIRTVIVGKEIIPEIHDPGNP